MLGTLTIQGLTLKPLLRALDLQDDDPVGRELGAARERALQAALATFEGDESPMPRRCVRSSSRIWQRGAGQWHRRAPRQPRTPISTARALEAAREAVLAMRDQDEIGDDAFHQIEEQLDWLEMAGGGN